MRVYTGEVYQGMSGWDINSDQELCSIDGTWLDSLPLSVGDNIRLESNDNGNNAAYTIARTHDDGGSEFVRMGSDACDRLYDSATTTPDTFGCEFTPSIPSQTSRSESEADTREEMWEETIAHPSHEFAVTAPHGGDVEHNTDTQARKCHEYLRNSSLWVCDAHGGVNGAFDRWHITSTDLSASSFPGLAQAEEIGYRAAVSFHGYSGDSVIVGGRAPDEVKNAVVSTLDEIDSTTVELASDNSLDGTGPDNFINRITESGDDGIQLEQPYSFRDTHAEESARRVAKTILNQY